METKVKILLSLGTVAVILGSIAYLNSDLPFSPHVKVNEQSKGKNQSEALTSENTGGNIDQTVDAIINDLSADTAIAKENDTEIDAITQNQSLINTNNTYNANEY
jgi:hypothetical protein